jgi:hypothetical protein
MRKRLEGEGQESPSKEPVTLAAPQLPPRPADDRERRLLRLRQEYHLMDDDELRYGKPRLERLIRGRSQ